jgi:hypothetical protein
VKKNKAAFGNLPNRPVSLTTQEFLPETQEAGRGVVVNQAGWEQQLGANKQAWVKKAGGSALLKEPGAPPASP